MNAMENYIREVLRNISASTEERQRIEADLRAHIQEALDNGDALQDALGRMGSPIDVAGEFMSQMPMQYAGFWRRLTAFGIDMIVIIPPAAVLAILTIIFANLVPSRNPQGWEYVQGGLFLGLTILCASLIVGGILLYFPILEGRFGQTVGKKVLGLRILKENGLPSGYKEAFLRRISFYFEGGLVIDALFIPFTQKHQRAFDIVARTIVIREKR